MLAGTGERVLVIGADGVLGSLTAKAFEHAGWDVFRGNRAAGLALDQADVVVNASPDPRIAAERSIMARGGLILNTAAPPAAWTQKLRASRAAAAGTVVLGAGLAPGLTNLVAAELLAGHPDADELEVVFTVSAGATSGRAGREFVLRHITGRGRHETRAVPLPPPFGTRECLSFAEGERAWIDDLAGPRIVRSYICFSEVEVHDALLARNRLGTIADVEEAAFVRDTRARTAGVSSESVAHWVCVRRAGRRLAARTIRCAGVYRGAALATVALALALQDVRAHAPLSTGVFGPEDVVALADLGPYLASAGIGVSSESV